MAKDKTEGQQGVVLGLSEVEAYAVIDDIRCYVW